MFPVEPTGDQHRSKEKDIVRAGASQRGIESQSPMVRMRRYRRRGFVVATFIYLSRSRTIVATVSSSMSSPYTYALNS